MTTLQILWQLTQAAACGAFGALVVHPFSDVW
jgi:hypothetical protein